MPYEACDRLRDEYSKNGTTTQLRDAMIFYRQGPERFILLPGGHARYNSDFIDELGRMNES
jgi:hypothetical protein